MQLGGSSRQRQLFAVSWPAAAWRLGGWEGCTQWQATSSQWETEWAGMLTLGRQLLVLVPGRALIPTGCCGIPGWQRSCPRSSCLRSLPSGVLECRLVGTLPQLPGLLLRCGGRGRAGRGSSLGAGPSPGARSSGRFSGCRRRCCMQPARLCPAELAPAAKRVCHDVCQASEPVGQLSRRLGLVGRPAWLSNICRCQRQPLRAGAACSLLHGKVASLVVAELPPKHRVLHLLPCPAASQASIVRPYRRCGSTLRALPRAPSRGAHSWCNMAAR